MSLYGAEAATYVKWVQENADNKDIKQWLHNHPGKMYIHFYEENVLMRGVQKKLGDVL